MAIHIGKLIKARLEEVGMSKSEFARRISRTSQNVYNLFERESVDTKLLQRISKVLHHDFFQHYANEQIQEDLATFKEEPVDYKSVTDLKKKLKTYRATLRDCQKRLESLEKENAYLKEINQLLKEKHEGNSS